MRKRRITARRFAEEDADVLRAKTGGATPQGGRPDAADPTGDARRAAPSSRAAPCPPRRFALRRRQGNRERFTARQEAVLRFIQRRFRRSGEAPTYREIAAHLGVDVKSASQHVRALERKGALERTGGRLDLLGEFRPERGIPVVGRVAAGAPILAAGNVEEYVDVERLLGGGRGARDRRGDGGGIGNDNGDGDGDDDGDLFLLRVRGDSMTGAGILDGDLVLVRAQPEVADGEVAAVVIGEEATVKRVLRRAGRLVLEPANPACAPIVLGPDAHGPEEDEVRIAGKVLMALRKL